MSLQGFQKRYLRGEAHPLKPVVHVGKQGMTEAVIASLDQALRHHELIKVKIRYGDSKAERRELIAEVCQQLHAEEVGLVGHTVTLYRQHPEPEERKIHLPSRSPD